MYIYLLYVIMYCIYRLSNLICLSPVVSINV